MKPKLSPAVLLLTLTLVLIAAVFAVSSQKERADSVIDNDRLVAATIYPVYDIVRQVAGDRLTVRLIVPPGGSPHTYEPTPTQVTSLAKSQILFAVGHGLDNWVSQLAESGQAKVVTVDKNIDLIETDEDTDEAHGHEAEAADEHGDGHGHEAETADEHGDGHGHEAETADEHGDGHGHEAEAEDGDMEESHGEDEADAGHHHHGGTDPHYWLDPANAKAIAATVRDELSKRWPNDAAVFADNCRQLATEIDQADQKAKSLLASLDSRRIITMHDAWNYFARAYDLTLVGTFEPTAGREPTPHYLASLSQAVRQSDTRTLYSEPQLSTSGLESFLKDNGLSVAVLDPIGGVPGRMSLPELFVYNAQTIADNQ